MAGSQILFTLGGVNHTQIIRGHVLKLARIRKFLIQTEDDVFIISFLYIATDVTITQLNFEDVILGGPDVCICV